MASRSNRELERNKGKDPARARISDSDSENAKQLQVVTSPSLADLTRPALGEPTATKSSGQTPRGFHSYSLPTLDLDPFSIAGSSLTLWADEIACTLLRLETRD